MGFYWRLGRKSQKDRHMKTKHELYEPGLEDYQIITGVRNPTISLPKKPVEVLNHNTFFQGWMTQKNTDILDYVIVPDTYAIRAAEIDLRSEELVTLEDVQLLESHGICFLNNSPYKNIKKKILGEIGT